MKNIKITITILFVLIAFGLSAQNVKLKGKITSSDAQPVAGAVVSLSGTESGVVQTGEDGDFEIETPATSGILKVSAEGYYGLTRPYKSGEELNIVLISANKYKYNDDVLLPFRKVSEDAKTSLAENIGKKDLGEVSKIENALQGEIAGLRVVNKSGMPGEGSYMNLRGIRSLVSNNMPLILINGVPFMLDDTESPVIGGFSKGILSAINVSDIQNITVLKGADAAIYGSLGANGVILIETEGSFDSDNLETQISFTAQYGINWNNQKLPVMNGDEYKSYLADVGMTNYDDMAELISDFPFLIDDEDYYYNYLYNNKTDWQDEIYTPSVVTNNVLRVEGGDAVAKYDISLGYMRDGGVVDGTQQNRYNTLINTSINVNRKLELLATIGLAYMQGNYQEQGMIDETNPVLVAYNKNPLLSPYKKDEDGNVLAEYDVYRFGVSNPLAIVKTLDANNKEHNVNLRFGANYQATKDIRLSGVVGMTYNYDQQNIFVPGASSNTIVPMYNDLAENTVRAGVGETKNMYYNLNATYKKLINDKNQFNANVGMQAMTMKREFDAGSGYNTANDFYQTLDYVESGSEEFYGYINEWSWMNFYGHADYTIDEILRASANVAFDGTSVSGVDANRFGAFPSAGLTFIAKNLDAFKNSSLLNKLNLRAEYGLTGNSRFSSNYGKNYYSSTPFLVLQGIVRSTIPNTNLKWEKTKQLDLGMELSMFRHRLDLSVDYYNAVSSDVLFAQPVSSVLGSSTYYDNSAEIKNSGVELAFSANVIHSRDFDLVLGGNITTVNNEVSVLGSETENIISLSDGAELITKVGENPYNFYGYKAVSVFASKAEAADADLYDWRGEAYEAGDVRYEDVNGDHVINDDDKQLLGSATPDFFGGFSGMIRYKNFSLSAEFTFSSGNDAYNATRRSIEALDSFNNQSRAAVNRWQYDGQITSVPRAYYGDPMDNNAFSSRWIEDASYLKLKYITLSYQFDKTLLNVFRSGTFYVTGENLFTWTDYLGLDPEFSYSYSDQLQGVDYCKVVVPKTFKFGFNLKF